MKYIYVFVVVLYCQICFGQSFKVKDFKMILSDITASTQPREDEQGSSCGLVKVLTKVPSVKFDGNVVGEVVTNTNEYWVYLKKGTTEFNILRPNYLPMEVKLSDYGIDEISAKTTYFLVLKEIKLNPEKNGLNINLKPRNTRVKIDDIPIGVNTDGSYMFLLPKGEHVCLFSAEGYKSIIKMIPTGKGMQTIDVELESIMADVNIVSQTEMAEIMVDKEVKGHGGWIGKMLPGKHVLEVRKEGFLPFFNTITLGEKETRQINIPLLQPIKAKIDVTSEPSGCKAYFDGQYIGRTPCTFPNALYGNHHLVVEMDSCFLNEKKTVDVNISTQDSQIVNVRLMPQTKFDYYQKTSRLFSEAWDCYFILPPSDTYVKDSVIEYFDKILDIIEKLDKTYLTKEIQMYWDSGYEGDTGIRMERILGVMIEWYFDHEITVNYPDYEGKYKKGESLAKAKRLVEMYGTEWMPVETIAHVPDIYKDDYIKALSLIKDWYRHYIHNLPKETWSYRRTHVFLEDWGDRCIEKDKKEALTWYKNSLTEAERYIQCEKEDREDVSFIRSRSEDLKRKIIKLQ